MLAFREWRLNLSNYSNLPADGRNTELSLQIRQNFPAEPKVRSSASCDLQSLLQRDKKALETCWDSREKHPMCHSVTSELLFLALVVRVRTTKCFIETSSPSSNATPKGFPEMKRSQNSEAVGMGVSLKNLPNEYDNYRQISRVIVTVKNHETSPLTF